MCELLPLVDCSSGKSGSANPDCGRYAEPWDCLGRHAAGPLARQLKRKSPRRGIRRGLTNHVEFTL